MKKPISVSELRANIYSLMSKVAQSGEPLFIERDGVVLRVERQSKQSSKDGAGVDPFTRIRKARLKPLLRGDPEELLHIEWENEWKRDDPS